MGNKGNWFAVDRDIFDHPVVGARDREFCETLAWLWLLANAGYEARTLYSQGHKVVLDPGQLMAARTVLAKRWKWTEDKVRWFLKRLQAEAMITRFCNTQAHTRGHTQPNTRGHTQLPQIITISNFSEYQHIMDDEHPASHPAQHPASHPDSPPQYKDNNLTTKQTDSPPLPPLPDGSGGEPAQKRSKSKKPEGAEKFTLAQIKLTEAAISAWNATAKQLGFTPVRVLTVSRRSRLLRRLTDIGGLDEFRVALSAIERVPFLMGKVPPRPGEQAFKLDIDRLLQSEGRLGDVLAKLIDKAGEEPDIVGPNGKRWGWWRGQEEALRAMPVDDWRAALSRMKPNGEWPWWVLTAPPGHAECLMPQTLIEEHKFIETYGGKIHHA